MKIRSTTSSVLYLIALLALPARAQYTETILHNFSDGSTPNDGTSPQSGLLQATDGNFYGTTVTGGANGFGTAYQMTPTGSLTIIHNFANSNADGISPKASLIQIGTNPVTVAGTTPVGGAYGFGTAFGVTMPLNGPGGETLFTLLASFDPSTASEPQSELLSSGGSLYGTFTAAGTSGVGGIYRIVANSYNVVYNFKNIPDGASPQAAPISDGNGGLYGTTQSGGGNGQGCIYHLLSTGTNTILHSFIADGNDGTGCITPLVLGSDGNLYGTCTSGGSQGHGVAFKVNVTGGTPSYQVLHGFGSTPNDGQAPRAGLVQLPDGNFYGTTAAGGSTGHGTVFMMTPSGAVSVLHSFADGSVTNDGEQPYCRLVSTPDGSLYGTTFMGGTAGDGTIFRLSPPPIDEPAMPIWGLACMGVTLLLVASVLLNRPAPSGSGLSN